ncbi:hypothetical protein HK405_008338 [Cladochytrium tenue]|nr:hypothetical protein HK405_008338 [Cladochytrium tenue]
MRVFLRLCSLAVALVTKIASVATAAPAKYQRSTPYNFQSEKGGLFDENYDNIPSLLNVSSSLTFTTGSSFWASSFVQGSNGHQYFLVMHAFLGEELTMRYGFMDITRGKSYVQAAHSTTNYTLSESSTGITGVSANGAFFTAANSSDLLAGLHYGVSSSNLSFDVSFGFSPVLLYGGLGVFQGTNGLTVHEWASPAGYTTGHLVVNGSRVDIQPAASTTWFDRQWGGAYAAWHWFEINLDVDGLGPVKMGVCDGYDAGTATWRKFVAVREQPGIQILEAVPDITAILTSAGGRTFTSAVTNTTYDLDYVMTFQDQSTILHVATITADQEIVATPALTAAYEGMISITGTYKGMRAAGYGVLEISTA